MEVPERLFTAPLPVVAAYLRSIFQAEGYVSVNGTFGLVAFDMISETLVRGVQQLLLALRDLLPGQLQARSPVPTARAAGISRIRNVGDQVLFADEIGFIDAAEGGQARGRRSIYPASATARHQAPRDRPHRSRSVEMEVYDIQTESGEYLSGNLRVHNCFILAVDDSHVARSSTGTSRRGRSSRAARAPGINLSTLRSSKEHARRRRHGQSGPVSFMRGADARAGTIKSGGKTRRAAKMVILNVDHPDVRDFIWCKAVEERKARVLRDAGFDMDLDGKDAYSTQYQNANNSVRVTDEFMQAFEQDRDWKLKAVLTGEPVETVRARDLMREIAQAAWECADPGMQYDTTINEWHTCPATGRINALEPVQRVHAPGQQRVQPGVA